jgi:tricarballylate dehydrogenase
MYDVIVVGAGNAGLTAALAAHQSGSRVLLLDKCPKTGRGGNTRLSGGGFRFSYDGMADMRPMLPDLSDETAATLVTGTYTASDYYEDVMHVTRFAADEQLTRTLADQSYATVRWLNDMGVKWVLATGSHAVKVGGKIRFPPGRVISVNDGGLGLIESLFKTAEDRGMDIIYGARAMALSADSKGTVTGVKFKTRDGITELRCKAVVLAAGGFEANAEMRTRYLGAGWDLVKVRGSRFNSGEALDMALAFGAQPSGQWSGCHAVLVDAQGPAVEAAYGMRYSYPYGIMVDINGRRFADEGEDFFPYTYSKLGREVLRLPSGAAFQIFDSKVKSLLRTEYNSGTCVTADTIEALGKRLSGVDWDNLVKTVKEYNEDVNDVAFDPSKKDGKCTTGITPVKSNWAQRLDTPPYYAYPVTCGITFTFGGIRITEKAEVVDTEENIIRGLFAAGEITGGAFVHNYPGGSGLMKGAVFGRIAGLSAAAASKAGAA